MKLAEAFAATPDETARLAAAPFAGTDEAGWSHFAAGVHEQVVAAYSDGDITLEAALRAVRSCSIGCRLEHRITILALTAEKALRNPPTHKLRKQQGTPLWVRRSAANLVDMFREDNPNANIAPNEMNGWTTPVLEAAGAWLVALGLSESVAPRTLYQWWLDANKAAQSNSGPTA